MSSGLSFDVIMLPVAPVIVLHRETFFFPQITLGLNLLEINLLASDSPKSCSNQSKPSFILISSRFVSLPDPC